jgi:hypothetical protein
MILTFLVVCKGQVRDILAQSPGHRYIAASKDPESLSL